jgi:hypothetical protein
MDGGSSSASSPRPSSAWSCSSLPSTGVQTHRIFAAELERLSYQCLEGCGRIDAVRSAWGTSARHLPHIDLEVGYGYAELTLQA